MGKKQKRNIELAMLLNYSQIIATIFAAVVFIIAGLFDKTIVDPFTFKSVVMWLLFGVYLPTIFLLFDESNKFVTTNFYRSLVANVSLYVLGVTAIYVMLIIQSNHLGFIGIGSLETANSISLLVVMILSLAILFRGIGEVIAYRLITFIICLITPVVYIVLLMFNVDSLDSITGIATSHLTLGSYVPGAIAALIDIGLYIVVLDIIEAVKGENLNVSSKSRS